MNEPPSNQLPPGQQLVAENKWPIIGEREPPPLAAPFVLRVNGLVRQVLELDLDSLKALGSGAYRVDLHCVTRWSKPGVEFTGVSLSKVLDLAGCRPEACFLSFVSLSSTGHHSSLPLETALAMGCFLATGVGGGPLPAEHGGPVRNIVPGRYLYKSVKWLGEIRVLAEDRLGTWEAGSGYHNSADPWREERYMAPALDKRLASNLIAGRDFRGHDLRSIEAAGRELAGLRAAGALLRDARFRGANLEGADFAGANLSNAGFQNALLRGARFQRADIEGAAFDGADLRGVSFAGCSLTGTTFVSAEGAARIDGSTQFTRAGLEALTPGQRAFVLAASPQLE